MSDETLKQSPENQAVLQAIGELTKEMHARFETINKRLDTFEKSSNAQFEAIRKGIVENSARFDRLESKIYSVHSDIFSLKANVTELAEEVHSLKVGV